MANTNTDLTEEDAADLQFPKEDDHTTNTLLSSYSNNSKDTEDNIESFETLSNCTNCANDLDYPYILCDICKVPICCSCFSNGAEFSDHKNDHNYRVFSTNFILFENSDWTADEELILLDSIATYGNWNLIAQYLPKRSASEIIEHYDYFYLQRNGSDLLPKIKEREAAVFVQPVVPYRFRWNDSAEPPRYSSNTIGYQSLAGYNPARSDFENEFDANAEDLLAGLQELDRGDPDFLVLSKLQCSIVNIYNRRLRERERWKRIISQHGLIILRKTVSWLHRYDLTITRPVCEKLIRYMQLCTPIKFEMIMEGLHRTGELKIQISRLIHLRRKGIKTLSEARFYLRLQQIHEENRKKLKIFRSSPQFNWKNNKNTSITLLPTFNKRKSGFAPIEIVGMPGYEKLTNSERDLCSAIRLVPITYLELKDVLIAENKKFGYLKLQTARRLLKIDVNKTRRLYDFLVQEGYIIKS